MVQRPNENRARGSERAFTTAGNARTRFLNRAFVCRYTSLYGSQFEKRPLHCRATGRRTRAWSTFGAFRVSADGDKALVQERVAWLLRIFAVTRNECRAIAERVNPVAFIYF